MRCLSLLVPVLLVSSAAASAQKVTLVAVGDICLAKGVEQRMREKGSGYPFAAMKSILKQADVVFGNLECCLATTGKAVPKKYNFRGHPENAGALKDAGFTVVSLANNHSLDFGKDALAETLAHVRSTGVMSVGAGMTIQSAHGLRIVTVRGLRIGFLAYLGLFPPVVPLTANSPAVAMAEVESVRRDVRAARAKVDVLIVSMHAGKEYTFTHSARQAEIAHTAIDAGADMVIGHHPHVVQDCETYRGKPIYYSLGNFVFDPSPTFLRDGGKRWSAMVVATLEKGRAPDSKLVNLRIVDRQPRFASGQDRAVADAVLTRRPLIAAP
jgi:poly-gamma-glutamate capsule biosynthesis protein CapA/YwtB (metallophosphatase superfamily)